MSNALSSSTHNNSIQNTTVNACAAIAQKGFERMSSEDIRKVLTRFMLVGVTYLLGREFIASRR